LFLAASAGTRNITIYYIAIANPKDVCDKLQQLFAGNHDITLAVDSGQKALIARGPAPQLQVIAAIIMKLDVSPAPSGGRTISP
jgi:type II secretory pathway component GspD/PulD (secretin)